MEEEIAQQKQNFLREKQLLEDQIASLQVIKEKEGRKYQQLGSVHTDEEAALLEQARALHDECAAARAKTQASLAAAKADRIKGDRLLLKIPELEREVERRRSEKNSQKQRAEQIQKSELPTLVGEIEGLRAGLATAERHLASLEEEKKLKESLGNAGKGGRGRGKGAPHDLPGGGAGPGKVGGGASWSEELLLQEASLELRHLRQLSRELDEAETWAVKRRMLERLVASSWAAPAGQQDTGRRAGVNSSTPLAPVVEPAPPKEEIETTKREPVAPAASSEEVDVSLAAELEIFFSGVFSSTPVTQHATKIARAALLRRAHSEVEQNVPQTLHRLEAAFQAVLAELESTPDRPGEEPAPFPALRAFADHLDRHFLSSHADTALATHHYHALLERQRTTLSKKHWACKLQAAEFEQRKHALHSQIQDFQTQAFICCNKVKVC